MKIKKYSKPPPRLVLLRVNQKIQAKPWIAHNLWDRTISGPPSLSHQDSRAQLKTPTSRLWKNPQSNLHLFYFRPIFRAYNKPPLTQKKLAGWSGGMYRVGGPISTCTKIPSNHLSQLFHNPKDLKRNSPLAAFPGIFSWCLGVVSMESERIDPQGPKNDIPDGCEKHVKNMLKFMAWYHLHIKWCVGCYTSTL